MEQATRNALYTVELCGVVMALTSTEGERKAMMSATASSDAVSVSIRTGRGCKGVFMEEQALVAAFRITESPATVPGRAPRIATALP